MEPLRIVFMGTPDFSVPSLEKLAQAGYDIAAVYSQPDKQRGRGNLRKSFRQIQVYLPFCRTESVSARSPSSRHPLSYRRHYSTNAHQASTYVRLLCVFFFVCFTNGQFCGAVLYGAISRRMNQPWSWLQTGHCLGASRLSRT